MNPWKLSTFALAGALAFTLASTTFQTAQADPQPHMHAALSALKTARQQLEKASPDKGGHRVKALALVKDAIVEVEKGINFDNKR